MLEQNPPPPRPKRGQKPYFDPRDAWDQWVEDDLTRRLSPESLTDTIGKEAVDSTGKPIKSIPVVDARQTRPSRSDYLGIRQATPNFGRVSNGLLTKAQIGLSSLYDPYVIKVDGLIPNPLGRYYVYLSTDHDDVGGIALAYCDTLGEALTPHGTVYVDTTLGRQTETPAILWNETCPLEVVGTGLSANAVTDAITKNGHGLANGRRVILTAHGGTGLLSQQPYYVVEATANTFKLSLLEGGAPANVTTNGSVNVNYFGCLVMYYQQDYTTIPANNQRTCYATSVDGLAWTRRGIAIDGNPAASAPHTGYAKPFRHGRRWAAHHLLTGGAYAQQGLSISNDGLNWYTDPRPLMWDIGYSGADGQLDTNYKISWAATQPFEWFGQLWTITRATAFGIFGGMVASAHMSVAPLTEDLRSFASPPVPTNLRNSLPDEAILSGGPTNLIVGDDGLLCGFYIANHTAESEPRDRVQSVGFIRQEVGA